jgi:LPXTG-motif cell wall-anchored protein
MQKFGFAVVAAIAVLLGVLGFSAVAQAYPEAQFDLTTNKQVVYGGDNFTATASASVDCAWDLDWNGLLREGSGDRFVTTYTAPAVTEITKIPVTGVCRYADSSARSAAATETWRKRLTITVLPSGSAAAATPDGKSDLPSTGGPSWVYLAGGLVLLLAGAGAVAVARARAEAEVHAPTA